MTEQNQSEFSNKSLKDDAFSLEHEIVNENNRPETPVEYSQQQPKICQQ